MTNVVLVRHWGEAGSFRESVVPAYNCKIIEPARTYLQSGYVDIGRDGEPLRIAMAASVEEMSTDENLTGADKRPRILRIRRTAESTGKYLQLIVSHSWARCVAALRSPSLGFDSTRLLRRLATTGQC
jgi:hypothetical protein